jgi:protein-disulfide isomerase
MKKTTTKTLIFTLVITLLVGLAALITYNYKNKTSLKYAATESEELAPEENDQDDVNKAINKEARAIATMRKESNLTKTLPGDFVLGSANAPVTMIEYASLSCPHCASFARESFKRIQDEYITDGKVKFVFRNFPLNQQALVAAMVAQCQAEAAESKVEKYYSTLKILFKTQDAWAFDERYEEKLAAIANLDSMNGEDFEKCVNNKELQEQLLKSRMEASQNLQLRSTPTFFINGEISEGYVDYVTLQRLIDKKLTEATK